MKKENKKRIAYIKPELMDLDGGEGIAGGGSDCGNGSIIINVSDCMAGNDVSGYCGCGNSAHSSGCNSGSAASCSVGSYV